MVPCCCSCCCCYWRADSRRLYRTELFCQRGCLTGFPQFVQPGRWFGMNRISRPDGVKLCVELNYSPNQNTKIPSATNLSGYLKNRSDRNEKSLHRHTIHSVAASKSPITLQPGWWETPFISYLSTENQNCSRHNQRRVTLTLRDRWGSSLF